MLLLPTHTDRDVIHVDHIDRQSIIKTIRSYLKTHTAQKAMVSIEIWQHVKPDILNTIIMGHTIASIISPASGLQANEIIMIK